MSKIAYYTSHEMSIKLTKGQACKVRDGDPNKCYGSYVV